MELNQESMVVVKFSHLRRYFNISDVCACAFYAIDKHIEIVSLDVISGNIC